MMDASRVANLLERHEQSAVAETRRAACVAQCGAAEGRLADAARAEDDDRIAVRAQNPQHELVEVGLPAEKQLGPCGLGRQGPAAVVEQPVAVAALAAVDGRWSPCRAWFAADPPGGRRAWRQRPRLRARTG